MIRALAMLAVFISLGSAKIVEPKEIKVPEPYKITVMNRWGEAKIEFRFFISVSAKVADYNITDVLLDQIIVYGKNGKIKRVVDYTDANQEEWYRRFETVIREQSELRKQRKIAAAIQQAPTWEPVFYWLGRKDSDLR